MSDAAFVQQTDPDAVFDLLADETRLSIIRELADAHGAVPFAELRQRVGVRDSGRFNYHLDKLVGQFVAKTDAGYELTETGDRIDGALEAGTYTLADSIDPVALEDPCPVCGGEQRLHYEDKIVRTECDCFAEARFHLPPSAVGAFDPETFPDVSDRYLKTTFYRITRGFCPYCDGQVRAAAGPILSPDEAPNELSATEIERARETPQAHFTCTRCDREFGAGLTSVLLFHPAVVSFYYDHGVDVQSEPYWQLKGLATDRERIRGREPFRAAVTYAVNGDRLTAVVDESLEVLEIDR
ncbi:hypothetical protein BRC62_04165 [Halobacteriales archaeon QH_10_67_13]|nr:MAG: hypothetical protein BRC62_04165 [Halobacteriales archaeon QH_10_67_13]